MLRSRSSIKSKRTLLALTLCVLLCCLALAVPLARQHFAPPQLMTKPVAAPDLAPEIEPVTRVVFAPPPQTSTQFDLSRHVIAGGGGTSLGGGSLGLSGTNGQTLAGTTSGGGQFTVTGGFLEPGKGGAPPPTPTPTPPPTPAPNTPPPPTPTPP